MHLYSQLLRMHIHAADSKNILHDQIYLILCKSWYFSIARSCRIFSINSMYMCTCSCVSGGYTDAVGIMIMQAHLGADEASTINIHVWLPVHVGIGARTLSLLIPTVHFPCIYLRFQCSLGVALHPEAKACFGV